MVGNLASQTGKKRCLFLRVIFQMFKPVRVVATILFLASIGLIFVGAFVIRNDVSMHPS